MRYDEFHQYVATIPAIARRLAIDHPYVMLLQQTILAVATFQDRHGINAPCDFICDEQMGFSEEVSRSWAQFKLLIENQPRSDIARLVGSMPIYRDDAKFLPLQAADLYAWQLRNYYLHNHRIEGQTIEVPPKRALSLINTLPSIFRHYSKAEFQRLEAHLQKVGEQFAKDHPDIPLIPISDDRTERKRARRKGRKKDV